MLKELHDVRQIAGDYRRRIFSEQNSDLVVWMESDGSIHGFCFSYDLQAKAQALTWLAEKGFSHNRIDLGEESPLANRTPILIASAPPPPGQVAQRFRKLDAGLPEDIRAFVRRKIDESEG